MVHTGVVCVCVLVPGMCPINHLEDQFLVADRCELVQWWYLRVRVLPPVSGGRRMLVLSLGTQAGIIVVTD